MKQVLQDLRVGLTYLDEVPVTTSSRGMVLIRSEASLISAGTERMLVEFGRSSLLAKARSQPEKVRQVLDKIRTDGLLPTLETVFNRLGEPLPLGYCNAGEVLEVGSGVTEFQPGDRVVSNGPHAEVVCVPKTLVAKIPDNVSDEQAAFTVLASIGLQGIRLAAPTLGETFVVVGLGLIGLVTAQLLRAHGCRVVGTDVSGKRLALAEQFGVRAVDVAHGGDPVTEAMAATGGRGVDGVLITASTKDDEIIHQAAAMCRKRGRIVLVGVVPLNLRRADFYEKEITFQVSCSYGPGRYDEAYEKGAQDYPYGFVRWTEGRNFEAVLGALADGSLQVDPLISHRFDFEDAPKAYETISSGDALGVILKYPQTPDLARTIRITTDQRSHPAAARVVLGVIGAGNFSKMTLVPALSKTSAEIRYIADLEPVPATHLAKKYGAANATTDYKAILADEQVNAVLVAVGHSLHARLVTETLEAGKHVFVEKPLAMNIEEVRQILDAAAAHPDQQVMVGFNRRFSPHIVKIKQLLAGHSEPLAMAMTVNAGHIPPGHWVHDPVRGGGRMIGEGCHFVDLLSYLAGSPVTAVSAAMMGEGTVTRDDKMVVTLGFEDGSIGCVNYFANGSKSYPKELLEVFSDGRVLRLENFRRTTGYGFRGFRTYRTWQQDKGHAAEFAAFVERVSTGGPPLIALEELVNTTLASFAAVTAARKQRTVKLAVEYAEFWGTTNNTNSTNEEGRVR
jgi:predicted dehydrogenase/threonine dehydrogenase-like Zn-dependent dehydrogenase